ncbi:DUF1206 domain-containing protein [soil metagenome]|jgi:hypothetical protein
MPQFTPALDRVQQGAQQATRHAAPWIEKLARLGYAAKGVVYIVLGLLALQAAFGGGQATDSGGALRTIVLQPFGRVLLGVIALGLFGYVVWRLVSAFLNPEGEKAPKRVGYAISGVIHVGLAIEAVRLAMGRASGGGNGDQASHWTAEAMSQPLGRWAVAVAGIMIAGWGLQQLHHAYKVKLDKQLALGELSGGMRAWVVRVGRAGLAARGIVFGIIGIFVSLAALHTNPSEARGLGGALQALEQQPFGPWLLGVVAVGLMAYGIYELVRARYRRIQPA